MTFIQNPGNGYKIYVLKLTIALKLCSRQLKKFTRIEYGILRTVKDVNFSDKLLYIEFNISNMQTQQWSLIKFISKYYWQYMTSILKVRYIFNYERIILILYVDWSNLEKWRRKMFEQMYTIA